MRGLLRRLRSTLPLGGCGLVIIYNVYSSLRDRAVVSPVNPNESFHSFLRDRLAKFKRATKAVNAEMVECSFGVGSLRERVDTRIYPIINDTMKLRIYWRILKNMLTPSRIMIILFIIMLAGLSFFLSGPKISEGVLVDSYKDEFTLVPYGNKTFYIPFSFEQAFYLDTFNKFVLKDIALVEINSSSPFTLYRLIGNKMEELTSNTVSVALNLTNVKLNTKLMVKNDAGENSSIKISILHILKVKTVDFTIPHIGFVIFISTLLALQAYSLKIYGDPLISTMVIRILSKAYRIELSKVMYYGVLGSLIEIVVPILLLCYGIYLLNSFPFSEPVINPFATDAYERLILLTYVVLVLFLTILNWIFATIRKLERWVYRHKGQEFLEIFEELTKLGERIVRIIFFPSLILIVVIVLVILLNIIVNLEVLAMIIIFYYLPLYYFILKYVEIKYLQGSLDGEKSKNILIVYLDIAAKTIGLYIFALIILFIATYPIVYPFLLTLTERILLLDFFPSIFHEYLFEPIRSDLGFFIIAFGRIQLLGCLALIGGYWITRGMILKFEPNYKNKISKDMVIFIVVTALSEYLTWSYQFFFENVTYSSHILLVSVLIGMVASILSALLEDIWPR
jgi:hypothetical protein